MSQRDCARGVWSGFLGAYLIASVLFLGLLVYILFSIPAQVDYRVDMVLSRAESGEFLTDMDIEQLLGGVWLGASPEVYEVPSGEGTREVIYLGGALFVFEGGVLVDWFDLR